MRWFLLLLLAGCVNSVEDIAENLTQSDKALLFYAYCCKYPTDEYCYRRKPLEGVICHEDGSFSLTFEVTGK